MQSDELREIATRILDPLERWSCQCHAASVELMRSGEFGRCRVARGTCAGVGGQHSWLVLGDDVYDTDAVIVDGTLWSYDRAVERVWIGKGGRHEPHGVGNIFDWGRPDKVEPSEGMELTPRKPWSKEAQQFMRRLGPIDKGGWITLAHAPVGGWPAGEFIDAMCESGLAAFVPIDRIGMLTDRNPNGLYLPEAEMVNG